MARNSKKYKNPLFSKAYMNMNTIEEVKNNSFTNYQNKLEKEKKKNLNRNVVRQQSKQN